MSILVGCAKSPDAIVPAATAAAAPAASAPEKASTLGGQRGNGLPYEVVGSEVHDVKDPVSGRDYQVFVALPPSYADNPERRYPVLYVTDADYAFPLARQIGRRLNVEGPKLEEFILVGLSYAMGDDGMTSRRRDYTPTPRGPSSAPADAVHGGAASYITYLRGQVLPYVANHYRTDESRRLLLGHSYGALLGTQILFTDPGLFSGYIVGSPSYWYDHNVMSRLEKDYAGRHDDLPASVYMYVGEYETPAFGNDADMVADARRMQTALTAHRYPSLRLKLDVLNDEDRLSVAPRGLTHGLKYLLGSAEEG
ncbi:alpha/beta hydrolase-fold protein [uncultured Stenotrophomonas sp.]|uniref:alpha/beta hydrolase n=1 Tax=uncultured Stenotrophomonas sp. TaxID=165438 RepID=UPI0028E2FDEC|nr:alpha/beta hydrolase-fold protein [uncultured Stenotrophomonas sp.]